MNPDDKLKKILSISEEIIGFNQLKKALEKNEKLVAYDGFEPSGKIHIAQGLMRVLVINKLIEAGIDFKILIADWLAYANNKMKGDLNKIKLAGEYYQHVWKACGLNDDQVKYYHTSEFVKDDNYWFLVMQIAKDTTLKRIIRCSQVMGRSATDNLSSAQILYPCMQAADIFYIGADIAQMGVDQRKVNMLTRQIARKINRKKPVAIHHHMLISLSPTITDDNSSDQTNIERSIKMKMSKSNPDSAIFMSDSPQLVIEKISKAYCPPNIIKDNPIYEYFRYIVFPKYGQVIIKRDQKYGGNITYKTITDFEKDYTDGAIYPLDAKNNLAEYINQMLKPVRDYFNSKNEAKSLQDQIINFTK